jgi:hypothetical protein
LSILDNLLKTIDFKTKTGLGSRNEVCRTTKGPPLDQQPVKAHDRNILAHRGLV